MEDDFDITAEASVDLRKHYLARDDKKRIGSLFQIRLDDELTYQMEHFLSASWWHRRRRRLHLYVLELM